MNVYENLKKNLKDLRKSESMTQEALAKKMQISRANLSRYETGENVPPLDILVKYAKFFDVTVDYLLGHNN